MYLGADFDIGGSLAKIGVGHDYSVFAPKSSISDYIGSVPTSTSTGGGGGNFGGFGSLGGAIGAGVQGAGFALGLANFGVGLWSTMEQMKLGKQAMKLARDQFLEENRRYQARENERLSANADIAKSAASYDNPMQRE